MIEQRNSLHKKTVLPPIHTLFMDRREFVPSLFIFLLDLSSNNKTCYNYLGQAKKQIRYRGLPFRLRSKKQAKKHEEKKTN